MNQYGNCLSMNANPLNLKLMNKGEVKEMIDAAIDQHNKNATLISMAIGFSLLGEKLTFLAIAFIGAISLKLPCLSSTTRTYLTELVLSDRPACPLNVRVGANSPSL